MSYGHIPDAPYIDTDGQDGGYCEICEQHVDTGRCPGHCENETCEHISHCDTCSRGLSVELPDGICIDCEIKWLAAHQIGYATT